MSKTRIFISSTCYDLRQVRRDLEASIERMGHVAHLSESPSFPVDPSLTTLENCVKVVRDHSDIYVLIIGGRRGSIDEKSGKSMVNHEYDAALSAGLDRIVFVQKEVMTLFPHWSRDPSKSFAPTVDAPGVFEFIDRLNNEKVWISQFEHESEIAAILQNRLSEYLRDLIQRKRAGALDRVTEFENETAEAQRLVREKPEYWEHLLFAELLEDRMRPLLRRYEELRRGLLYKRGRRISTRDFLDEMMELLHENQRVWGPLNAILEQSQIGSGGEDRVVATETLRTANLIAERCRDIFELDVEFLAMRPPKRVERIKQLVLNGAGEFAEKITEFSQAIRSSVAAGATGVVPITIKLEGMRTHDEIMAEMGKLTESDFVDDDEDEF